MSPEQLDLADSEHDYPTETDDGLVMRCRCGVVPPSHLLGQQVDEALWLWEHCRAARHATVASIVTAAVEAERARIASAVEAVLTEPEFHIEVALGGSDYVRRVIRAVLTSAAPALDAVKAKASEPTP